MIELIQFPWSPFCLVQRRILEYAGVPFKTTNIPPSDRSLVWELTRQRYYGVPVIRDGATVVFETGEFSQIIAKYLDAKLELNLFPKSWQGIDRLLWRNIEDQIEGATFRLNDIYWEEVVPPGERLAYLRHKERKFGPGCLEQWRASQPYWIEQLTQALVPYELMLAERPCLLRKEPHFLDFDLWGMLANFLYSGHYQLPVLHPRLNEWFERMSKARKTAPHSEKLHT
jgi:glutathione S-transferase